MSKRSRWMLLSSAGLIGAMSVVPLIWDASKGSMTAYVVQVVSLTTFIAPLLALASSSRRSASQGGSGLVSGLIEPVAALVVFNALFIYCFLPSGHRLITAQPVAYAVSLLAILAAGTWLWRPLIRPFSEAPSPMVRLGYILLVTVPQTFVGITMAITHPAYAVAGSILALVSKSSLFVAFAILFARLMRESNGGSDDGGENVVVPAGPPPDGIPQWLTSIQTGPTVEEPSPEQRPIAVPRRQRRTARPRQVSSPARKSLAPRQRPRSPGDG